MSIRDDWRDSRVLMWPAGDIPYTVSARGLTVRFKGGLGWRWTITTPRGAKVEGWRLGRSKRLAYWKARRQARRVFRRERHMASELPA